MTKSPPASFDLDSGSDFFLFLKRLFVSDFMPHGHCFYWRPDILWLHVVSDLLIGVSYYSIPFALFYFVQKRKDIAFRPIFHLFAGFIFWCGTTHLMNIWTMWHGTYRLDGMVKLMTAMISVFTSFVLWPLIPKALALPSPLQMKLANEALEKEIKVSKKATETIRELNRDLEKRVQERTLELARSNEELEQFAYVASHDLQQPLRMIANYSELLQLRCQDQLSTEGKDYLQTVLRGAVKMQTLIGDLLEFSRVGRKELAVSRIHMNELVDAVLKDLEVLIKETGAKITCDPLPEVDANPLQISQVFQNLLSNALKYSRKVPVVHLAAFRKDKDWVFSVRDQGIGIESEFQEKIFNMFQRLHADQQYPGAGMGLAICKKIILRHGGKIWVESKAGEGSTFLFSLPSIH